MFLVEMEIVKIERSHPNFPEEGWLMLLVPRKQTSKVFQHPDNPRGHLRLVVTEACAKAHVIGQTMYVSVFH